MGAWGGWALAPNIAMGRVLPLPHEIGRRRAAARSKRPANFFNLLGPVFRNESSIARRGPAIRRESPTFPTPLVDQGSEQPTIPSARRHFRRSWPVPCCVFGLRRHGDRRRNLDRGQRIGPPQHERDHHDPVNQDRAPSLSGSLADESLRVHRRSRDNGNFQRDGYLGQSARPLSASWPPCQTEDLGSSTKRAAARC
jgi:hypothetical protein